MEEFIELYVCLILGTAGSVFGLVLTILERRLVVTRKPVAGSSGFSVTIFGGIVGAIGMWQVTDNYYYMGLYLLIVIIAYVIICALVKKKEYPEEEQFKKE